MGCGIKPPSETKTKRLNVTQSGKMGKLLSPEKFREINSFTKNVAFTKFLPEHCESKVL